MELIKTNKHILLNEDFSDFAIGPFPYDHDHSAMGEYHTVIEDGYHGNWYDPITNWDYKGPSWIVTASAMDGNHFMEQMRICHPKDKGAIPVLRAGDEDWSDYTATVKLRPFIDSDICGFLFRYQTSMMHYGLFLVKDRVVLQKVIKTDRITIGEAPFKWSADDFYTMKTVLKGSSIKCYINDSLVIEAEDSEYSYGAIALSATMPTQYESVKVEASEEEYKELEERRKEHASIIQKKMSMFPQPQLYKKIDLGNFGAGRQIRFGHLTGTDELFFIMCQHQRRIYKDRYPFISAMTAVSLDTGEILWQIGTPRDDEDVIYLTTDLPFQIYDINGDGKDEVIASWDFKLFILDGATGKVIKSIDTPENVEPTEGMCGLEFKEYAFKRLNVDAIRIVNVSGKEKPSDILIKDRYSRLWVYDKNLNLKWKFSKYNTGHFPFSYDIDRDGKDEIFSCYNLVDHDGKLIWSLPINKDHTDEIIIGDIKADGKDTIAIVSGWEGFMVLDAEGNILVKDINGHGQRISVGSYIPELKGLEICTTTYWGNNAIVYMHDCNGKELWHKEMLINGNTLAPVNWDGSGQDLIMLNGDVKEGGLMDGEGDVVVKFPDDGHPTLCSEVIDITGDCRDEIVLWDRKQMYIYTQDREAKESLNGVYHPIKYPHYNSSNYRGEYSFPRFSKEK